MKFAPVIACLLALSTPALAGPYSFTPLIAPDGTFQAGGLNDAGQVIGLFTLAGQNDVQGDALFENGAVAVGGLTGSGTVVALTGLNNNGGYVGYSVQGGRLGTPASFTGRFGTPRTPLDGAPGLRAADINDAGQVVGAQLMLNGPAAAPTSQGFLRQPDGMVAAFAVPGAVDTAPSSLNNPGVIVGTFRLPDAAAHGFVLSDGVFTTFDVPGAAATMLASIDDAGAIAGTYSTASGASRGFLYAGGAFTDLAGPDGRAFLPVGLNNPGQMIGRFAGDEVSVLATPQAVPEPASLAVFLAGLAGCIGAAHLASSANAGSGGGRHRLAAPAEAG